MGSWSNYHIRFRCPFGDEFHMKSGSVAIHQVRSGFERSLRTVMEHDLANLAGIRNRPGFGRLQVTAAKRLEKAAMHADPKIALQVVVRLGRVKHARQHQAFHQLDQPAIAGGASDDQVKVGIPLNLLTICFDSSIGSLLCLLHDLLELGEVIFRKAAKAQLNGEQVEGIDKSKNLGVIFRGPGADIKAARRTPLHDSDLFQAMQRVTDRRPAHIESTCKFFFTETLVGDEFALFRSVKDFENDPIGEGTIDGFGGKSRSFVEQT